MMNPKLYPPNWKEISKYIRFARAGGRCECYGQCGLHSRTCKRRCIERNGEKAIWAKGNVILTVAHLCHHTDCGNLEHLAAMCNRCHLRYDRFLHVNNARKTRERKSLQMEFNK